MIRTTFPLSFRAYRELVQLIRSERVRLALKIDDPKTTRGVRTRWRNRSTRLARVQNMLTTSKVLEFNKLREEDFKALLSLIPRSTCYRDALHDLSAAIEKFLNRHPLIKLAECAED